MTTPTANDLVIYEITNRTSGDKSYQAARNAQDACQQAGWLIADCYINAQKPRYKPVPDHAPLCLVKLPCEVCPFQYAECLKPDAGECPAQPTAPELGEWLVQAAQAHLCQYSGQELKKTEYQKRQKWVTIEDAIKLLSPNPPPPSLDHQEPPCHDPLPTP